MHLENTKVKCVTLSCGEKIWRNRETWDFIGFDIPLLSNPTVRTCPMFEGLLERFFSGDLHGLFQRKKFYGSEKHAAYYGAGPRIHTTDFCSIVARTDTISEKEGEREREREENIKCAGFAFGSKTKTDKQENKSLLTFTLSCMYPVFTIIHIISIMRLCTSIYCIDIYQPLSTITHDESIRYIISRHVWSFVHWQVCLWHFTICTNEVSWRWFSSEKLL